MILYHGSDIIVAHPDTLHSKEHLDFGVGFYTTSIQLGEKESRFEREDNRICQYV